MRTRTEVSPFWTVIAGGPRADAKQRFGADSSGSVATEYAIIAVLIAAGIAAAVGVLGESVHGMYQTIAKAIAG